MASDKPTSSTRDRILDATLGLIQKDPSPVSMSAIAKAAQLSRQALYLVFENKADIFIALVRRVDEMRGLPAELAKIEAAATGVEALERMVVMQAKLLPMHRPIAQAVDSLRRQDPDAERAWQDRLDSRHRLCRSIVKRLDSDGALRDGLSVDIGTDLAWALTSFRLWSEFVFERGWTAQRYKDEVFSLLLSAVVRHQHWPAKPMRLPARAAGRLT